MGAGGVGDGARSPRGDEAATSAGGPKAAAGNGAAPLPAPLPVDALESKSPRVGLGGRARGGTRASFPLDDGAGSSSGSGTGLSGLPQGSQPHGQLLVLVLLFDCSIVVCLCLILQFAHTPALSASLPSFPSLTFDCVFVFASRGRTCGVTRLSCVTTARAGPHHLVPAHWTTLLAQKHEWEWWQQQ